MTIAAAVSVDPELVRFARDEAALDQVPGLAIGIVQQGRIATTGLGITNVDHPQNVDGSTLFQIGSVTKTFTATALLQLVDDGRLDLDDPVRSLLPDFRVADEGVSETVTIRDCLTHSCGWSGDVFADTGDGDDALARMVDRLADLEQATPLGRLWAYNNAAFYPLGRILEVVDGCSYEQAVNTRIFEPLGMTRSCFFARDVLYHKVSVGHTRLDGRTVVARPWAMPRSANPVGGIVASAEDLMRYAHFQLHGAADVLSDELRLAAHRPAGPDSDAPEVGLGWWLEERSGECIVSHGGGANGQPCLLTLVPGRGFAIAVLTNGSSGGITARRIIDRALSHHLGIPEPTADPADTSPEGFARVATAAGTYETDLDRWVLRVEQDRAALDSSVLGDWLTDPYPPTSFDPVPLDVVPMTGDRLLISPDSRTQTVAELLRNDAGQVCWLRYHRRAAVRR